MVSIVATLDAVPIPAVFVVFTVAALLCFDAGFRFGRRVRGRQPDHRDGSTPVLVGSLLGLLAFLLAVTMSMASDRFDTRRQLVLTEANSIGTTYLRAGYLPAPYADDIRRLLREYAPLRVNAADPAVFEANLKKSTALQDRMWAKTEELARDQPSSQVLALFIESLNETIDVQESRVTAIVYARVPATVLLMLLLAVLVTIAIVGYSAGLAASRGLPSAVVLVFVLGALMTLLIDLDRPRDGLLQVSQQPLIDLVEQIGPP